ncbi:hypothetical protein HZ994_02455 [Akkermansiaceae bacterium]|nr:hypothetical protein HZ994_02455 [Akkermansiaceae bacterium]
MITFPCPQCAIHITAEPEHAGCEANCPKCDQALVVPKTSDKVETVAKRPDSPPLLPNLLFTAKNKAIHLSHKLHPLHKWITFHSAQIIQQTSKYGKIKIKRAINQNKYLLALYLLAIAVILIYSPIGKNSSENISSEEAIEGNEQESTISEVFLEEYKEAGPTGYGSSKITIKLYDFRSSGIVMIKSEIIYYLGYGNPDSTKFAETASYRVQGNHLRISHRNGDTTIFQMEPNGDLISNATGSRMQRQ